VLNTKKLKIPPKNIRKKRLHGFYKPDSQELSSRGFLKDFFHPFIEKRRKGSTSYMLIVYTSSSTDEILDLEASFVAFL
jgi:hypothetical protein